MKPLLLALALVGCALGLLGAACGSDDGDARGEPGAEIVVLAAADLRFAFEELAPRFANTCGCKVTLTFGSSGNFASQIEQGIPADLFFSANVGFVDSLETKGLIVAGTKQLYAVGRIVLAKPAGRAHPLETLKDLTDGRIGRVSIANPDHAPYGVAAQQALESAGLWASVKPKLVLGENASQASQFVETGDADAGIIPLSLAITRKDKMSYVLLDESLHAPLLQGTAVLKTSKQPELAREFIAYVNGEDGRAVMERFGFVAPPNSGGR